MLLFEDMGEDSFGNLLFQRGQGEGPTLSLSIKTQSTRTVSRLQTEASREEKQHRRTHTTFSQLHHAQSDDQRSDRFVKENQTVARIEGSQTGQVIVSVHILKDQWHGRLMLSE